MNKQKLANRLKDLLDKPIDPTLFPVKKGNKINIGSYSIVRVPNGYSIKSYVNNEIIAETYSKSAAIAIAKNLSKKRNIIRYIMELDDIYSKNYIDCMFYEHILRKSKDDTQYYATLTRFEISNLKCVAAKDKIESYILGLG